jgi:hypothetical protein
VTYGRSRILAALSVLAALAATLAACGGNDDDAGAVATTATATTAAPADRAWERVVAGGDCQCSDGSDFSFWVREANPKKVVFFSHSSASRRRISPRSSTPTRARSSAPA